jgi:acetyl esterase/lipase
MTYHSKRAAIAVLIISCVSAHRVHAQGSGTAADTSIAYVSGGTTEQRLDIFRPRTGTNLTTIVFTYGGGWQAPRSRNMDRVCEAFRSRGFLCVLVSHRLGTRDRFPAQVEDVAAASAWVLKHAEAFGGDPHRIFIMGHSSGAHLSLLQLVDPRYLAKYGAHPSAFAGLVALSTPTDLRPRADGRGFGDALLEGRGADTFRRDVALMTDASPIVHLSRLDRSMILPPMLLIVGANDFPALPGDDSAFVSAMKAAGRSAELLVGAHMGHMDTVGALVEASNVVVERVLAFMRRAAP